MSRREAKSQATFIIFCETGVCLRSLPFDSPNKIASTFKAPTN